MFFPNRVNKAYFIAFIKTKILRHDDDDIVGLVGIAQFGTFPATFALVPLDNSPEETMENAKQTKNKIRFWNDLFLLNMF